jgi:translocation and assembly module TamA
MPITNSFHSQICCTLSLFFIILCLSQSAYAATVKIEIEGLEGKEGDTKKLQENVLNTLTINQQKDHPRLSDRRIKRLNKQAPEQIKQALQPFGYYNVNVTAELTPPRTEQDAWVARYVIELGEPLKFKAVDIQIDGEAKNDQAFQKQLANFPIKVGDSVNSPNYEKAKQALRNLAEERGYFEAKFIEHKIIVDETAQTASLHLSFDSKQRYRFGNVTFQQQLFDESLLQRFLTFKTGDPYTGTALLAFKNSLSQSDYFSQVKVNIDRNSPTPDLLLPVITTLEPAKPNQFSAGIGYGTDTGPRGSIEWKRRYINRYGHRISTKAEMSEIRRSVTANYEIPTGRSIDNFVSLTAGYKDEHTNTSESEIFLIGINKHHSRNIFNRTLSEVIGIEYRDERYAIGSDTGHAKLLMPNANWSYVKADNRIYTLRGYKIHLDVRGALDKLGSNASFLQTHLDFKWIRQIFKNARIITRGEVGYSSVSLLDGDFHDLPPSIRFFAGGDRSVRGYDYQTLGPKNVEGQVIGGKNLLVGSLEYEHKIIEKWSLAVFYDVGNAFNDFSESIKHGTGFGVRWQSPVGPVRIDIATALGEDHYPIRLHINIGPDL